MKDSWIYLNIYEMIFIENKGNKILISWQGIIFGENFLNCIIIHDKVHNFYLLIRSLLNLKLKLAFLG